MRGVTEAEILDALDIAHGEIKKLTAAMEELQQTAGKEKLVVEAPSIDEGLLSEIRSSHGQALIDEVLHEVAPHRAGKEQLAQKDGVEVLDHRPLVAIVRPLSPLRIRRLFNFAKNLWRNTMKRRRALDHWRGLVLGLAGGLTDELLMRLTDLFLAFPALVFAAAIATTLGRNLTNTMIALATVYWPWYARLVRSQVLVLANQHPIHKEGQGDACG